MTFARACHPSLCVLFVLGTAAWPQETRIEQARQFQGLEAPRELPGAAAPSAEAGRDLESFGVQQILQEKEPSHNFQAFTEISAFVTNNVVLTRRDPRNDSFLVATFGFEGRWALPKGFLADAAFKIATFRYNEFGQLNFNSIDAGAGVSYHAAKLGGLDLFARYNFNTLLSVETEDTFFRNHTVTVGAQKAVPFSQANYAFFGASGQAGFAAPTDAGRTELAAYAGCHLAATTRLDADLLYRYGYYIYSHGGRRDRNQTVSLGLRYRLTDWCSVSATSFYVWDRANQPGFGYDAGTAGGALTLSLQF